MTHMCVIGWKRVNPNLFKCCRPLLLDTESASVMM